MAVGSHIGNHQKFARVTPKFLPLQKLRHCQVKWNGRCLFVPGLVAAEDEGSAGAAFNVGPVCAGSCAVMLATI
jgi:hypothetical protein